MKEPSPSPSSISAPRASTSSSGARLAVTAAAIALLPVLVGCGTSIRNYPSARQAREASWKWIEQGGEETETVTRYRTDYTYVQDPNPAYQRKMAEIEKKNKECENPQPTKWAIKKHEEEKAKRYPGERGKKPELQPDVLGSVEWAKISYENALRRWERYPERLKTWQKWVEDDWQKLLDKAKKSCEWSLNRLKRRLPSPTKNRWISKQVPYEKEITTKYRSCDKEEMQYVCVDSRREGKYTIFRF